MPYAAWHFLFIIIYKKVSFYTWYKVKFGGEDGLPPTPTEFHIESDFYAIGIRLQLNPLYRPYICNPHLALLIVSVHLPSSPTRLIQAKLATTPPNPCNLGGGVRTAMAAVATVSSASGLLAMLQEPAAELKLHALASLNSVVHLFWPEISTSVPTM